MSEQALAALQEPAQLLLLLPLQVRLPGGFTPRSRQPWPPGGTCRYGEQNVCHARCRFTELLTSPCIVSRSSTLHGSAWCCIFPEFLNWTGEGCDAALCRVELVVCEPLWKSRQGRGIMESSHGVHIIAPGIIGLLMVARSRP